MAPKRAQAVPRVRRKYFQLARKARLEQALNTISEFEHVAQTMLKGNEKLKTALTALGARAEGALQAGPDGAAEMVFEVQGFVARCSQSRTEWQNRRSPRRRGRPARTTAPPATPE